MSESTASPEVMIEPVRAMDIITRQRGPSALQLFVLVAIIGAGVLLTALTSNVTKISEPGVNLVDGQLFLVDHAGDWKGGELQGLTEAEKQLLPPDTEGARRLFKDNAGHEVFCSVVLAGHDVTSIHRPELCLPGQGWRIQEHLQFIPVAAAPHGRLEVMHMNGLRSIALPDGRTARYRGIFVYWFIGKNRVTARHWQRILWTSLDRVFHNTNHRWAYVLIYAPERSEGPVEDEKASNETMSILSRFVQDIYPALMVK